MSSTDLDLQHRPEGSAYEAVLDRQVISRISYRMRGSTMVIASTVTDPAHRGAGHASVLTRWALDDVRRRGLRVVPQCPYTADWIDRHPDYADLLADPA